ncbi:MAG: winged helix-turn-helix domain-containing protein [Candidatus Acidiferrum sp.]
MPSEATPSYRFGVFELDPRTAELLSNGTKLRLQDQPYQILLKLLEHRGELVTRDELRSALWPADTFVDFETGLNTAVKRLRQALGDDAEHPTFIETIPRRGYRFIAPVRALPARLELPALPAQTHLRLPGKILFNRFAIPAALAVIALLSIAILFVSFLPRPPSVANVLQITNDGKSKIPMNPFVTDGLHLYFIEGTPWTSGSAIAQLSEMGGETTWINTSLPEVLAIYSISPDRSKLMVVAGTAVGPDMAGPVWIQPLPAGSPHRVGSLIAASACWTPDGNHILYGYERALYIANADGSSPQLFAKIPGVLRSPRYSPDGRRIRFSLLQSPGMDDSTMWEIDADGKHLHPLFSPGQIDPYQCCGNWSPDGKFFYFQAGRGPRQAIWVFPDRWSFFPGAAAPSQLLSGPLRYSVPVPSGDGKKLFVIGDEPRVELVRYDIHAQKFGPYLPSFSAGPVNFSADGKWMAYTSYPDMTLWRSRPDGSEKIQLTFPPVRAYGARWSPDDSSLAFTDVRFSRPWRIRLISSSGGVSELLDTRSGQVAEADPTWMPDGRSIVFANSGGVASDYSISRMDLKTRQITPIPGSVGLFSPRLSPDGRYLSALNSGQTKLILFDFAASQWSTLALGEGVADNEWSHDEKYVYFRHNNSGAAEISRVRISDRSIESVLSLKDFPQITDMFAAWFGLTPDDTPLLMRDRSIQELYSLDLRFH